MLKLSARFYFTIIIFESLSGLIFLQGNLNPVINLSRLCILFKCTLKLLFQELRTIKRGFFILYLPEVIFFFNKIQIKHR